MTPDRVAERKAKLAVWVREGLVKLGPTFIKIGQQFSTRVDVLSPEFVKELEKLQVGRMFLFACSTAVVRNSYMPQAPFCSPVLQLTLLSY